MVRAEKVRDGVRRWGAIRMKVNWKRRGVEVVWDEGGRWGCRVRRGGSRRRSELVEARVRGCMCGGWWSMVAV